MSFVDCCIDNGRDFRINFLWFVVATLKNTLKKKKISLNKPYFDIIDPKKKEINYNEVALFVEDKEREKKNISSLFFNEQF